MDIPFNQPWIAGPELEYIGRAIASAHLSGDGAFTRRCQAWLEQRIGCRRALLTTSCTAALEMAALLVDIKAGDEIIMPSYTFVTTATAFVLRGGVPIFVDIRPDTLNLDERAIEAAVSPRTRVIVPVHYAGVGCEMTEILRVAERHGLTVIEDAAQGLVASCRARPLGSFGHMAALSFHETKNVMCGEGGALLVNDPALRARAELIWEKGTNRRAFFEGLTDKYTWMDLGSSFYPSEITAAFLWAQLERADAATAERLRVWKRYHEALAKLEETGRVRRPVVPSDCVHNAHMYYLLLAESGQRPAVLKFLNAAGINAVFHYVPLHSSPAGRVFGRTHGPLPVTDELAARLIRLPLWIGLGDDQIDRVVGAVYEAVERL